MACTCPGCLWYTCMASCPAHGLGIVATVYVLQRGVGRILQFNFARLLCSAIGWKRGKFYRIYWFPCFSFLPSNLEKASQKTQQNRGRAPVLNREGYPGTQGTRIPGYPGKVSWYACLFLRLLINDNCLDHYRFLKFLVGNSYHSGSYPRYSGYLGIRVGTYSEIQLFIFIFSKAHRMRCCLS